MSERTFADFRVERSLEPDHPRCSFSHEAMLATRAGRSMVVKAFTLPFRYSGVVLDDFVGTLRRAARATTRSSSVLIPVIDVGVDGETPWYAMEVAVGEPLQAAIERGQRFSVAQVRRFAEAAVVASEEAGERGCALELNPRHVMLTGESARFWDVGLSAWFLRSASRSRPSSWTLRHEGMVPELLRGEAPTSIGDVQALALLAFVMLSGRWYWNHDHPPTGSVVSLGLEILSGVVEPPSVRSPVPLPAGFDEGFRRCLAGEIASLSAALEALELR